MRRILKTEVDARKVLPLAFLVMLAFAGLLAWKTFSSINELLSSESWVEHTQQILSDLNGINAAMEEARSEQLRFLDAQEVDTKRLEEAAEKIDTLITHVTFLTQENHEEQEAAAHLRRLLTDDLQNIRKTFTPAYASFTSPVHASATALSLANVESVHKLINTIRNAERQLLRDRNARVREHADRMKFNVSLGIAAFSLIMGVLFYSVMRESQLLRQAKTTSIEAQTRAEVSLTRLQTETDTIKLLNDLQQNFQICLAVSEAYEVIARCLEDFLPGASGFLAMINNSRNIVERVMAWGDARGSMEIAFAPEDCCAMRGGRLHLHAPESHTLACRHFDGKVPECCVCLPLVALGETLGMLHIRATDARVFSPAALSTLQRIVEQAEMTLANLGLREKLHNQSIRDPLTGLFNRRYLEITLERELSRSQRQHSGLGVIMVDADRFKQFNDSFGHEAGDLVLKEIATLLLHAVRAEDVVCRFGGEEFVLILPDSTAPGVYERAEGMREAIAKLQLEHCGQALGKITASFGVSFGQNGTLSSEVLLRLADEALYQAKKRGRDRVCLSDSVHEAIAAPPSGPQGPSSLVPA